MLERLVAIKKSFHPLSVSILCTFVAIYTILIIYTTDRFLVVYNALGLDFAIKNK